MRLVHDRAPGKSTILSEGQSCVRLEEQLRRGNAVLTISSNWDYSVTMKTRQKLRGVSNDGRLDLWKRGLLSNPEITDAIAEFGASNYQPAVRMVEAALDSDDSLVRYNAMATLAYEWGTCSRLARIEEILLHDNDADCRRQAAGALGSLKRSSSDLQTLKLLREVAGDDQQPADLRAFVYTASLGVLGLPRNEQPSPFKLVVDDSTISHLDRLIAQMVRG